MAVFAKVFDAPGGQWLVRKTVFEMADCPDAAGIECVFKRAGVYFSTIMAFNTKANRNKVFDAVTEESFLGASVFRLPNFFYENGVEQEYRSVRSDPED